MQLVIAVSSKQLILCILVLLLIVII